MKKAMTAIIAVIILAGAIYYGYTKMKELGYFSGSPAPAAGQMDPGMGMPPGGAPAPAPEGDTTAAPAAPAPDAAPSASTTAQ